MKTNKIIFLYLIFLVNLKIMSYRFDPIMHVKEDGLVIPEIGIWGIQKYKLMGMYCDIFTTGMKNTWEQLVYVDLFAGAGFAKIRNEGIILKTSSLIAGAVPHKFTKYVICEQSSEKLDALKHRMEENTPGLNIDYIEGDSNRNVD